MERNTTKEKKARKLLVEAQRKTIEESRLLDSHAAAIYADRALRSIDTSLECIQEPKKAS
jgi:hypothetical protein